MSLSRHARRRCLTLVGALALSLPRSAGAATQARAATATRNPHVVAGLALHDQGDYDGAIREYARALAANARDVEALYETAYSYQAKRDYRKAVEVAQRGVAIDGPYRPLLYLILGTCRKDLGDPRGAIEAYRKGIAGNPRLPMLPYNLGVAHAGLKEWDAARLAFRNAVALSPSHPGSLLGLSQAYEATGYRIPALLALLRFLSVEPDTVQSRGALATLERLLSPGAGRRAAKTDEGDFGPIETALAPTEAAHRIDVESKRKPEPELTVGHLDAQLRLIASVGAPRGEAGFARDTLLPFFRDLGSSGQTTAFAFLVYQGSTLPGVDGWLKAHAQEVTRLRIFMAAYRWPAPKVP